jgi:hypothetical protein
MWALILSLSRSAAFVVFDKKVESMAGKVGEPVSVLYNVYNYGDSLITDLHVDDAGIPLEQWNFSKSAKDIRWNSLSPHTNLSFAFEATPLIAGNLRMGSSRLRYLSEGERKIAYSSQVFWFHTKGTRSIGAKSNLAGYAIVIGASLASIFIPLLVWTAAKPKASPAPKLKTN